MSNAVEQVNIELKRKDEHIRQLNENIQYLHGRIDKLTREKRKVEVDMQQLYASFSWRASSLLRAIRFVVWTLPILSFQWAYRIILDKGLISNVSDSKKQVSRGVSSTALGGKKNVKTNTDSPSKKKVQKTKPSISNGKALSISDVGFLIAMYETKYVGINSKDNPAWNEISLARMQEMVQVDGDELTAYDLRNPGLLRRHANKAQAMGLNGFCYHYRASVISREFDGPIMNHYRNKDIGLNYCVCWSDESVDRERYTLLKPNYIDQFINYCRPLFHDSRYIYINDKPVVVLRDIAEADYKLLHSAWQLLSRHEKSVTPIFIFESETNFTDENGAFLKDLSNTELAGFESNPVDSVFSTDAISYKLSIGCSTSDDIAKMRVLNAGHHVDKHQFVLINHWNNWATGQCLEGNGALWTQVRNAVLRTNTARYQRYEKPLHITFIVDKNNSGVEIQDYLKLVQGFGIQVSILDMDNDVEDMTNVKVYRLRSDKRYVALDLILKRIECQACTTGLALIELNPERKDNLIRAGWRYIEAPASIPCQLKTLLQFRQDLTQAGMYLPSLTVYCDVDETSCAADVKRFLRQLERQYLVPIEVVLQCSKSIQSELDLLTKPESTFVVRFEPAQTTVEKIITDAEGELVWLTNIYAVPTRNFLSTLADEFKNKETVIGFYDVLNRRGQQSFTSRFKVKENDRELLAQGNIYGQFDELMIRKKAFQMMLESYKLLDGLFHSQRDWIYWLLLSQDKRLCYVNKVRLTRLVHRINDLGVIEDINSQVIRSYLCKVLPLDKAGRVFAERESFQWTEIQSKIGRLECLNIKVHA